MALETENKTYEDKLPELLAHEGKFVLIHGTDVIDFFDSYADALQRAYDDFGLEPFLIKQVRAIELVHFVARV